MIEPGFIRGTVTKQPYFYLREGYPFHKDGPDSLLGLRDGDAVFVPLPIFHLMKGDHVGNADSRWYASEAEAMADLQAAVVAYIRHPNRKPPTVEEMVRKLEESNAAFVKNDFDFPLAKTMLEFMRSVTAILKVLVKEK